jgi:hypothetical protein
MLFRVSKILLLFVLLHACKSNEPPPEGILSEDQMVEVLVDIHLAEGIKQTGETTTDRTLLQISDMYQAVFEHHGITEESFRESFDWYSRRELIFDRVYEKVIERLNAMTPGGEGEAAEMDEEDQ